MRLTPGCGELVINKINPSRINSVDLMVSPHSVGLSSKAPFGSVKIYENGWASEILHQLGDAESHYNPP